MRTFGVEEELLLVDAVTGVPRALAPDILDRAGHGDSAGFALEAEMQQEMIEVVSSPCTDRGELLALMRAGRRTANGLARDRGARAVALASSPLPVQPHTTLKRRYQAIAEGYAGMARTTLECGFHVHVGVADDEEGVAVLNRIRAWLPAVLALSANSPFRDGEDTGHASFRFVVWHHWPTAGPIDVLADAAAYRAFERELVATGAILDTGMLYFDARLSRNHGTVEVRIADVCLAAEDGALLACVVRALVDQAADDWRSGIAPLPASTAAIRLASWLAARHGMGDRLVDPVTGTPRAAVAVIERMLAWVGPALRRHGDEDPVREGVRRIARVGTGAERQRTALREGGSMAHVLADAAAATQDAGITRL
ncbi:glutamate--cysteine ligase [Microbacterium sp. NPDC096154]|uniref:carboxylate-amine ligase n=1 Tax=Microbacterium sp. NPDC096154 TaxID=3155549 RepID=UPI0033242EDA